MKEPNRRRRVAWVKDVFCPMSETFIYEPLKYFSNWHPIVFCHKRENSELFPYKDVLEFNEKKYQTLFRQLRNRFWHQIAPLQEFYITNLKKHDIKLIHAHFGSAGVECLPFARHMKIPLVTNFYGYDVSVMPHEEYWKATYPELFSKGDIFIVEGPHMNAELARIGCPPEKIRLVHIGVDLSNHNFAPRAIEEGEKAVILMAGRFVEKKGMEYGIRAIAKVVREFGALELRIIGDGPLKESLLELVSDLELKEYVKFLGLMSHEEFKKQLYEAHIGLVPSTTAANGDSEGGAPKILLEMQASGLPVVATRHADIPNVTLSDKSALLVPERDVESLAGAIVRLLRNTTAWANMGREGSEYIRRDFALERTVAQVEMLYSELTSREA